ncbi:M15 family metallopeptidase [Nocardioides deserti]|uniref:M15 family metallopeptidase n=1 Tax=Nocardioides deserti TaxID=1588644 RepID=A0ABR6UDZ4_9ACTN|nr:M15 family metallopeptidase [Nocardioides deserti]MBC2962378.1 M15 family metallopeptidase [Nocardioides deserti]
MDASSLTFARRSVLAAVAGTASVSALSSFSPAGAVGRRRLERDIQAARDRILVGRRSLNGWEMERGVGIGGQLWERPLTGTGGTFGIRSGDVEVVLIRVVRRFHYEVAELAPASVVGFLSHRTVGRGHDGNHASGTAVDVLPTCYPLGARGGFFPDQVATIRDILAECRGLVAWGGDFAVPVESHFEIAAAPEDGRLGMLASQFRAWDETPGRTPGVAV